MQPLSCVLLGMSVFVLAVNQTTWGQPPSEPAAVDSATIDSATIDSATIDSATIDSATIDSATIDSTTVDPGESERDQRAAITVGLTSAGVQRNVVNRWATLAVNGTNRTSEDTEEISVVMMGDDTRTQFARKLWIPAGARRQAWLPIKLPRDLYLTQLQIPYTSIHLKESEQGESFQSNAVGMPMSSRSLLLSWEDSRAAMMLDPIEIDADSFERAAILATTVYAGRDATTSSNQDLGMTQLNAIFLPPTANPLDSLDQIVIASDRVLQDTVGVARIQSWLQSGGRAWIMADQVSPEAVRTLVGDAMCYSIVDRVQLNDFEMEQMSQSFSEEASRESWSSETPEEMIRVLIDTDDVHSRIDGWPTAFWVPFGRGEILFTTLGPRGWLRGNRPTQAYDTLAARFFINRLDPTSHHEALAKHLNKEIGYQIPGRRMIAGLLGAHAMLIFVAGIWLARRRELHYMGLLIPAAAIVASVTLFAVGKSHTTAVPSTIATGQIIRGTTDLPAMQVESIAAIYSQDSIPLPIHSSQNAVTRLHGDESSGEVRRILWDDSGQADWLFVKQPQGKIQHTETNAFVNLAQPWSVHGQFTPRGFEGRVEGIPPELCEDPVMVALARPSLSVELDPGSGSYVGGKENVLLPDQFFDAALISDTQQDRQSLIRELLKSDLEFLPREPSLLFWTKPIDDGTEFANDFVRRGWALATIPVRLERPERGSTFQIPASFVRLESHAGARGPSTVFNSETGRWFDEMNRPSESELRCQIPKTLLPCQLMRCEAVIKITAPGRTLEVKGKIDGKYQTLQRVENPAGRVVVVIDNPDSLSMDSDGGFLISISVSETEQERAQRLQTPDEVDEETESVEEINVSRSTWAIDYVHLNLVGFIP